MSNSSEKNYPCAIGKFAQLTALSIDTLRYYEHKRLLRPGHDAAGRRQYRQRDFDDAALIVRLKGGDFSIAEIQEYVILKRQGAATTAQRYHYLQDKLVDLHQRQARLTSSVDYVEEKIALLGQQLTRTKD